MRTIIELPLEQVADLDSHCRREHISRAEAIRRAVAAMLATGLKGEGRGAFGLWRARAADAQAAQERLRNEWN